MALYLGKKRVAPSVQVKVPSMKAFFDAGGKCGYSTATSFEGIIKYEDTSNVTDMSYMFNACEVLRKIPEIDTSNVTNMSNMFNYCRQLYMENLPKLNTSKVTDMSYMFQETAGEKAPELDTSKVTNMSNMFSCQLSNRNLILPLYDTSNVTSMRYMCDNRGAMKIVPAFNVQNVTNMFNMLGGCYSLTEIHMYGMKTNFDISASTKFTREALVEILNNLATVTSTQTLTMGSTNLAKLTDEDKAIATGKGWTLAQKGDNYGRNKNHSKNRGKET